MPPPPAGSTGAAVALYLAAIAWILGYDTIYAHQDREDDALVGVRSTARLLGERSRPFLAACYARDGRAAGAGRLAGRAVAGLFFVALALPAALLARQVLRLDIHDPGAVPAPVQGQPRGRAGDRAGDPAGPAVTDAGRVHARPHRARPRAPLVPEIALHLATEITPIWQATEDWLQRTGIEPPFWAFAWPGGQALARHVLDHPALVAGRRVLDFAAGCGIAAIACARAGAALGGGGRDRPAGRRRDRAERRGQRRWR